MELLGKRAIVTGGNRGIGRAISLALADKGANVVVHFYKKRQQANETLKQIQNCGAVASIIQADVRDFGQVRYLINAAKRSLKGIDILVNNAGMMGPNISLEKITPVEWNKIIEVNLTGVFYCCKEAAPELRNNKGKIVNISSIAGKMGGTAGPHYAAAKAGVIGLTFALAKELAPDVTVNAVAPGPVDTDLITPEQKKALSKKTPFKRIATPEEIAHTVIYLLENDYVSGEVVDVNAGRYMD